MRLDFGIFSDGTQFEIVGFYLLWLLWSSFSKNEQRQIDAPVEISIQLEKGDDMYENDHNSKRMQIYHRKVRHHRYCYAINAESFTPGLLHIKTAVVCNKPRI